MTRGGRSGQAAASTIFASRGLKSSSLLAELAATRRLQVNRRDATRSSW
jgi:hypothetical protein